MATDPVCGLEIEESPEAFSTDYEGTRFYFCSYECREMFLRRPEQHATSRFPSIREVYGRYIPRLPIGGARGEFDLWVEDERQLNVGDRSAFTREFREGDLRKFAEASGDTNALHINEAFARHTRFGGRIVHGVLVTGLISAALACLPGLSIFLSQQLEFQRPARIGETLTAVCEILEDLGENRFRLRTTVENAADTILIEGTSTIMVDPLPEYETLQQDSGSGA